MVLELQTFFLMSLMAEPLKLVALFPGFPTFPVFSTVSDGKLGEVMGMRLGCWYVDLNNGYYEPLRSVTL